MPTVRFSTVRGAEHCLGPRHQYGSRPWAPHSPPRPRVALRQISPQPSGFAGTCVQWTRRTGAPVVPSQASAKNGANLKKGAP